MRYVDESREVGTKSGRVVTWMRIICDTLADLPAPDAYDGITICMGSQAFVIADGSKHVLQSGGQWVQQGASSATYTRAEIDSMIARIDATEAEDRAALIAQQSEINYAVNTGVKNFLDVQHPTTTTRTSYTPLANGGVELSCSSAIWTSYNIADIPVEAGKEYIITFLLDESSGTSNFHFFLRNDNSSGTNLATKNYGSTTGKYEASFTPNSSIIWLGIYINNSATAATATAKLRCMIRPAKITDPTFQPYALPNPTLTPAAIKAVDEGAKNLIQNNCHSKNVHGVTATTNADGSITISGASDYANNFLIMYDLYAGDNATSSFDSHLTLEPGTYINKGTGRSDVKLQIVEYNTSSDYSTVSDGGTDTTFTLTKSYFVARLWISKDANFSTPVTVYPMICTAADWAVSQKFVPYAPSNRELYEMIKQYHP